MNLYSNFKTHKKKGLFTIKLQYKKMTAFRFGFIVVLFDLTYKKRMVTLQ